MKTWKNAKVGDKAWVTFFDRYYHADAQHLVTITVVGDKGIACTDGDNTYYLLDKDIKSYTNA